MLDKNRGKINTVKTMYRSSLFQKYECLSLEFLSSLF